VNGTDDADTTHGIVRPLVTVSYAQTLDGRLATVTGNARWISGAESLRFAHELRASHDGIMVGVDTVRQDDPALTVRHVNGRDPLRVIADSTLRTPFTAAVLANGAASGTLLAVVNRAPEERCDRARALGATVVRFPEDGDGRVDLESLLAELYTRGIHTLMVEGGARLITSLLRLRLVDRLAVCIAPKILGAGIEAVGDLGICDLAHAVNLDGAEIVRYGDDFVLDARVSYPDAIDGR